MGKWEKIVGTWKDAHCETRETYAADKTVVGEVDEVFTFPVAELGFGGVVSVHVRAKARGRWELDGDQLTVSYDSAEDVVIGKTTFESEALAHAFGPEFVTGFAEEFQQQLQEVFQTLFCEQTITITLLSVDGEKLVARYADGETECRTRVSPY